MGLTKRCAVLLARAALQRGHSTSATASWINGDQQHTLQAVMQESFIVQSSLLLCITCHLNFDWFLSMQAQTLQPSQNAASCMATIPEEQLLRCAARRWFSRGRLLQEDYLPTLCWRCLPCLQLCHRYARLL